MAKVQYYFTKLAIYIYCILSLWRKRIFHHKKYSKDVYVISVAHLGDNIIFLDCLRELRIFFSKKKGYKLHFVGNSIAVNYYKFYSEIFIDEYISIDTEYNLTDDLNFNSFLSLCKRIGRVKPEKIIVPFQSFWGTMMSAVVDSREQWGVTRIKEVDNSSLLYQYIKKKNVCYMVECDKDEMMFRQYENIMHAVGVSYYRSKIGIIMPKKLSDIGLENVIKNAGNYCVIVPGAMEVPRRWHWQRYVSIIRDIREKYDMACIIIGTVDEVEIGDLIKKELNNDNKVFNIVGKTMLDDLIYILHRAKFAVGNDTGTAHLASAVGTEYIVLMSYKDIGRYFPYRVSVQRENDKLPIVVWAENMPDCSACNISPNAPKHRIIWKNEACKENVLFGRPFLCLDQITVEQVITVVDSIINKTSGR